MMKYILLLTLFLGLCLGVNGQSKVITQKEVYDKIIQEGIEEPIIVLKQAIHESTNFKSKATKQRNNIFGIRNGQMHFDSIFACIEFYKKWQSNRYKGGDYFKFLKRIKYATDPHYKKKVNNVELDFIIE